MTAGLDGTVEAMAIACACCGKSAEQVVASPTNRALKVCFRCLDWMELRRTQLQDGHTWGWRAVGVEPVFAVASVDRALDHYARLGFDTARHDATHGVAHRDRDLTIHLAQVAADATSYGAAVYLHVEDADAVTDEWRRAGLAVKGPDDTADGEREGVHVDPDGNVLRVASPSRAAESR